MLAKYIFFRYTIKVKGSVSSNHILSFLRRQESRSWIPHQVRDDSRKPLSRGREEVPTIPKFSISIIVEDLRQESRVFGPRPRRFRRRDGISRLK